MCAIASIAPPSPVAETARLPEPQTRGYIVNLVHSLSRNGLQLEISRVAQAGFNLFVFPGYSGGWTLYPSEALRERGLPAINPVFRKWNPLAEVTALARQAELTVWTYARAFDFHPRYSVAEHRLLRKFPAWRQRVHPDYVNAEARRHEQWHACPLNHEYRRFLADVLCEMVLGYPVDGIVLHFDGLGMHGGPLEDSPYCFCRDCCLLYYETFGKDLLSDAAGRKIDQVRAWQLEQIHEHYSYLRHRLIRSRRTLRVVGRARPDWRDQPDYPKPPAAGTLLMDWPALLASGAIEELAIDHDDEPAGPQFGERLAADYAYLGDRVLFLPILTINDLHELRRPLEVIDRYPVPGFLAEFASGFTEEQAAFLRETYFQDSAPLPESDPVRTAAFLLSRIRQSYEDQPVMYDLLYDILRLLAGQLPQPSDFHTLEVIEQNIHGLEQFIRRGRLGSMRIPESVMRDLGLARRFVRMACMDVRS